MAKDEDLELDKDDEFGDDIGFDEFDDLDFDMDAEANEIKNRTPIESFSAGVKKGVGTAYSKDQLAKTLKRVLPSEYGKVGDEADAYFTATKDIVDDAVSSIRKDVNKIRVGIHRAQPYMDKVLPKPLAKLLGKLGKEKDDSDSGYNTQESEEEIDNRYVANELSEFAELQKASLEMQQQVMSNDLIKTETERKRFASQQEMLGGIGESLRAIHGFHSQVTFPYYRKNLEINLRLLNVQRRGLTVLREIAAADKEAYKNITYNTSLPDLAKVKSFETVKDAMLRGMITGSVSRFSEFQSNFREGLIKNVSDYVKGFTSNISSNVDQALGMVDMVTSMSGDSMGFVEDESYSHKAGNALAKGLANKFNRFIGQGLVRKFDKDGKVSATGINANRLTKNIPQLLNKIARNPDYTVFNEDSQFGEFGNRIISFIADMAPKLSDNEKSHGLIGEGNHTTPAVYDNLTRKSIVDIIPTLLSHIHSSVEGIRLSIDPNTPQLDEGRLLEWDHQHGRLRTRSSIDAEMASRIKSSFDLDEMKRIAISLVNTLDADGTSFDNQQRSILIKELIARSEGFTTLDLEEIASEDYKWTTTVVPNGSYQSAEELINETKRNLRISLGLDLEKKDRLLNQGIATRVSKAEDYFRQLLDKRGAPKGLVGKLSEYSDTYADRLRRLGYANIQDGMFSTKTNQIYKNLSGQAWQITDEELDANRNRVYVPHDVFRKMRGYRLSDDTIENIFKGKLKGEVNPAYRSDRLSIRTLEKIINEHQDAADEYHRILQRLSGEDLEGEWLIDKLNQGLKWGTRKIMGEERYQRFTDWSNEKKAKIERAFFGSDDAEEGGEKGYVDQMVEKTKTVYESAKARGKKASESIRQATQDTAAETIKDIIKDKDTPVKEKAKKLKEVGKFVAKAAKDGILTKEEQEQLDTVIDGVKTHLDNAKEGLDKVSQYTKKVYENNTSEGFRDKVDEALNKLKDKYENTKSSLNEKYKETEEKAEKLYDEVRDSVSKLEENEAVKEVKDVLEDETLSVKEKGVKIGERLRERLKSANLSEKAKKRIQEMKTKVEETIEDIRHLDKEKVEQAKEKIKNAEEKIKEEISQGLDNETSRKINKEVSERFKKIRDKFRINDENKERVTATIFEKYREEAKKIRKRYAKEDYEDYIQEHRDKYREEIDASDIVGRWDQSVLRQPTKEDYNQSFLKRLGKGMYHAATSKAGIASILGLGGVAAGASTLLSRDAFLPLMLTLAGGVGGYHLINQMKNRVTGKYELSRLFRFMRKQEDPDNLPIVDIYVKGEKSPRLLASKLRQGHYRNRNDGSIIYLISDIEDEVIDISLDPPEFVLRVEDFSLGVIDYNGVETDKKLVNRLINLTSKTVTAPVKVLGYVKKLMTYEMGATDMYDPTDGRLIVKRFTMMFGGYVNGKGKTIHRVKDIEGGIFDAKTGDVIYSEEELREKGLVDKKGRKIRGYIVRRLRLAGDMMKWMYNKGPKQLLSLGKQIGIDTLEALFPKLGLTLKSGVSKGSQRLNRLIGSVYGKEQTIDGVSTRKIKGSTENKKFVPQEDPDSVINQMKRLFAWLKPEREGHWKKEQEAQDKATEARREEAEQKRKEAEERRQKEKGSGILGLLNKSFPLLLGALGGLGSILKTVTGSIFGLGNYLMGGIVKTIGSTFLGSVIGKGLASAAGGLFKKARKVVAPVTKALKGTSGRFKAIALAAAGLYAGYKAYDLAKDDIDESHLGWNEVPDVENRDENEPEAINPKSKEKDESAIETLGGVAKDVMFGSTGATLMTTKVGAKIANRYSGGALMKGAVKISENAVVKKATTAAGKFITSQAQKTGMKMLAKAGAKLATAGAVAAIPVVGWVISAWFAIDTILDIVSIWKAPNTVERFKILSYGIDPDNENDAKVILDFEEFLYKNHTKIDDNGNVTVNVDTNSKAFAKQMAKFVADKASATVLKNNTELQVVFYESWQNWFNQRFLPVYKRMASVVHSINPKVTLPNVWARMLAGLDGLKDGFVPSFVRLSMFDINDPDTPYIVDFDPFFSATPPDGENRVENKGIDFNRIAQHAKEIIDEFSEDEYKLRKKDSEKKAEANKKKVYYEDYKAKYGKAPKMDKRETEYTSMFSFEDQAKQEALRRKQLTPEEREAELQRIRDGKKLQVLNKDGTKAENVQLKGNTLYIDETSVSKLKLDDRSVIDDLIAVRMRLYGLKDLVYVYCQSIIELEQYLYPNLIYKGDEVDLKDFDIKAISDKFSPRFDYVKDDPGFLLWLSERFLPIYLYYVKTYHRITKSKDLDNAMNISISQKYDIALALSTVRLKEGLSPWDVVAMLSPSLPVNRDPSSIELNLENLRLGLKMVVITESQVGSKKETNWRKAFKDAMNGTKDGKPIDLKTLTSKRGGMDLNDFGGVGDTRGVTSMWESMNKDNDMKRYSMDFSDVRVPNYGKATPKQTELAEALFREMEAAGFSANEKVQFLSQIDHESGGLKHMEENYRYREHKHLWGRGPGAVFEAKYGVGSSRAKSLGNYERGDGAKYYGRGPLQITGRSNYEKIAKIMNIDIVNHPELVATDPNVAAKAAIGWWLDRKSWDKSFRDAIERDDPIGVSRGINRYDDKHLKNRIDVFKLYKTGNGFIQKLHDKGASSDTMTVSTSAPEQTGNDYTATNNADNAMTSTISSTPPMTQPGIQPVSYGQNNANLSGGGVTLPLGAKMSNITNVPQTAPGESLTKDQLLQQATPELVSLGERVTRRKGSAAKEEGIAGLKPDMRKLLFAMLGEYYQKTGRSMTITSAYRSPEYQRSLGGGNNPNVGSPNGSMHVKGLAVDLWEGAGWEGSASDNRTRNLRDGEVNALFNTGIPFKWGFTRPLLYRANRKGSSPYDLNRPWETWHIENKLVGGRPDSFLVPDRKQDPDIVGKGISGATGGSDTGGEDTSVTQSQSMSSMDTALGGAPQLQLPGNQPATSYVPATNESSNFNDVVNRVSPTSPTDLYRDTSNVSIDNNIDTSMSRTPPTNDIDQQTRLIEAQQNALIEHQTKMTDRMTDLMSSQLDEQRTTNGHLSRLIDLFDNMLNEGRDRKPATATPARTAKNTKPTTKNAMKPIFNVGHG